MSAVLDAGLIHQIGSAAGAVYVELSENGEMSVTKLRKAVGLPAQLVDHAIGWLAREDKIVIRRSGRTTLVGIE